MSITSDIRSYADTALEQGKTVVGQAQTQFIDVTTKATGVVFDLRTQAEKTVNLAAIKSAVEPYLAQAKQYRSTVTDRAEGLFESVYESVKNDKRVAKVITTAESLTGVVVETVQDRVVKPVASLTGRGSKPAPAKKPAAKRASATKSAATRPARKTPAKKAATKTTARKTTARKTTARKAPAKKATQS
jgi:hypothetical protein